MGSVMKTQNPRNYCLRAARNLRNGCPRPRLYTTALRCWISFLWNRLSPPLARSNALGTAGQPEAECSNSQRPGRTALNTRPRFCFGEALAIGSGRRRNTLARILWPSRRGYALEVVLECFVGPWTSRGFSLASASVNMYCHRCSSSEEAPAMCTGLGVSPQHVSRYAASRLGIDEPCVVVQDRGVSAWR